MRGFSQLMKNSSGLTQKPLRLSQNYMSDLRYIMFPLYVVKVKTQKMIIIDKEISKVIKLYYICLGLKPKNDIEVIAKVNVERDQSQTIMKLNGKNSKPNKQIQLYTWELLK